MLEAREGVTVESCNACRKCICDKCSRQHNADCPKYKGKRLRTPCGLCEYRSYVVQCDSLRWE